MYLGINFLHIFKIQTRNLKIQTVETDALTNITSEISKHIYVLTENACKLIFYYEKAATICQ